MSSAPFSGGVHPHRCAQAAVPVVYPIVFLTCSPSRNGSIPLMARSIAADTLREFVAAMLLTLIDGRVLQIQEGANLMKVHSCKETICRVHPLRNTHPCSNRWKLGRATTLLVVAYGLVVT